MVANLFLLIGQKKSGSYVDRNYAIQRDNPSSQQVDDVFFLMVDSPLADRTIRLPMPGQNNGNGFGRYSKFRCSGDENHVDGYVERLCVFENVCYDRETDSFKFYTRKSASPRPVLFESKLGELYNFTHNNHGFVALTQLFWAADLTNYDHSFAPQIIMGELPVNVSPNSTLRLSPLHVLWSTWASDDNLGHLLWEEIAGIWYAMIRMNVLSTNVTAMHWPDSLPERNLARKFRDAFFPAITSTSPVSFYPYLEKLAGPLSDGIQHICFDELLIGGNVRRFLQRMSWHNYGHEPLFFSLRSRILETFGFNPYSLPQTHQILIVHKTNSNYHFDKRYQTHRSIYNIDEVVKFIVNKYSQVSVCVVDLSDYSIKEQLDLLLNTTLLLTPAGGISMLLPFLPNGANAIILDYLEKEDNELVGTKSGESVSMEAPFWNFWPHVKKLYYQVRSKEELRPDDPNDTLESISWRDEASVNINLDRLEALMDMAFENMST